MKSSHFRQVSFCLAVFLSLSALSQNNLSLTKSNLPSASARTISFDNDWRFIKDSTINAVQANYDDGNWRKLDLPHDWY